MAVEIERKFRILDQRWRDHVRNESAAIRQFYLAVRDDFSSRVRVLDGKRAVLTLKTGAGLSRGEYEYDIPVEDAHELEAVRLGKIIEKHRHRIDLPTGGLVAEVDVFGGVLASMTLAEVELPSADHSFELPAWLGPEVTADPAHFNAQLAFATEPPPLPAQAGADPQAR